MPEPKSGYNYCFGAMGQKAWEKFWGIKCADCPHPRCDRAGKPRPLPKPKV